jgi:hypothetical protein
VLGCAFAGVVVAGFDKLCCTEVGTWAFAWTAGFDKLCCIVLFGFAFAGVVVTAAGLLC